MFIIHKFSPSTQFFTAVLTCQLTTAFVAKHVVLFDHALQLNEQHCVLKWLFVVKHAGQLIQGNIVYLAS